LTYAVRRAQLFRNQRIVVQRERPPGAGKVVKLAARNGLGDAALGEQVEHGFP
jgi:hypothetical protein